METASPTFPFRRRKLLRGLLRAGIAAGLGLLTEFQVIGRENIPHQGPLLIVGNHFNFLDPVALIHTFPDPIEFIGGRQAPNAPGVLGWIRNLWGILPVSRGSASRETLLRAQQVLNQGGALCIFPEGGSWAAVLRPPRPGAALLAARSGAAILPVGLDGFVDIGRNMRRLRRTHVTVNIGKPFGPYRLEGSDRSNRGLIDAIGHEIMRHVAELLPPERHGFYSNDPAIREAAKGTEIYPWENQVEQ